MAATFRLFAASYCLLALMLSGKHLIEDLGGRKREEDIQFLKSHLLRPGHYGELESFRMFSSLKKKGTFFLILSQWEKKVQVKDLSP